MRIAGAKCPSVEDEAKMLAREAVDFGERAVFWYPHPDEVRLVYVSDRHIDCELDVGVLVFGFKAHPPKEPYKVFAGCVNPEDWKRVKAGELELPEGWTDPVLVAGGE